ncbi:hypothetical protein EJ110_NYTH50337 [Nymphaea thermarum]|nr:hypothetical protein EJ110_NYTH50337 [Nymphaea thermarum]
MKKQPAGHPMAWVAAGGSRKDGGVRSSPNGQPMPAKMVGNRRPSCTSLFHLSAMANAFHGSPTASDQGGWASTILPAAAPPPLLSKAATEARKDGRPSPLLPLLDLGLQWKVVCLKLFIFLALCSFAASLDNPDSSTLSRPFVVKKPQNPLSRVVDVEHGSGEEDLIMHASVGGSVLKQTISGRG